MKRPDASTVGTALALLLCAAFVASFLFGLRGGATPAATATVVSRSEPPERSAGRVEVLNASGRAGLARAATDRLRNAGFDVVFFGNAGASAGDSSVVLVRTPSDAAARAAARHLGIPAVRADVDTTLFVDATIILGKDWAATVQPDTTPEGIGRRLRRWLGG